MISVNKSDLVIKGNKIDIITELTIAIDRFCNAEELEPDDVLEIIGNTIKINRMGKE